jgi:translation initiation factor IF-1
MQQLRVIEGLITENLPNTQYRVKVTDQRFPELAEKTILCHAAGRLRRQFVRLLPGDRVRFEMTEYDVDRGRIVFKFNK